MTIVNLQVDMSYSIMTYAATGAVAIRETKLGKRQLFQIRNLEKSHAQLKGILEKAKQKLLKGEPAEQVKLWAKEATQQVQSHLGYLFQCHLFLSQLFLN